MEYRSQCNSLHRLVPCCNVLYAIAVFKMVSSLSSGSKGLCDFRQPVSVCSLSSGSTGLCDFRRPGSEQLPPSTQSVCDSGARRPRVHQDHHTCPDATQVQVFAKSVFALPKNCPMTRRARCPRPAWPLRARAHPPVRVRAVGPR